MAPKRKSVLVETSKQMLVKIPEHLLAEVRAMVESKQGKAEEATDVEILKAAAKSSRSRCRKLLDEVDAILQHLHDQLTESARLLKGMSCPPECYSSKLSDNATCRCGHRALEERRQRMVKLFQEVYVLLRPPDTRAQAKAPSTPSYAHAPRCSVCNEYESDCGCLVFNDGPIPEEEDDDDLNDLLDLTDDDHTSATPEDDSQPAAESQPQHPVRTETTPEERQAMRNRIMSQIGIQRAGRPR